MVDVNLLPAEYKKRKEALKAIFSKTGGVVLVLLILSLLLYGGLLFYKSKINENLENIRDEIVSLDQKRDPEIEKVIIDLDKKLAVLKDLFEDHLYWSKLFDKIEQVTIPQVYFSQSRVNFLEDKIDVVFSGNASGYTNLARQILSFQEESMVESVRVSGISLTTEGGVGFDLSVNFSKEILLNHD